MNDQKPKFGCQPATAALEGELDLPDTLTFEQLTSTMLQHVEVLRIGRLQNRRR